jgi:hypothetical protein
MRVIITFQMALRFVKGLERAVSGCGQSLEGVYLLVESIHSPYCQLLVKYPSMETQLLRHQLHSVKLVGRECITSRVPLPNINSYCVCVCVRLASCILCSECRQV